MFKADDDRLPLILVKLLNKIKESGMIPSEWKNGVICQDSKERRFK